ncbi:hypothetical protein EA472_16135 [Natrarchaeobius oligotrophus]|uniref:Uncharacterized protein n=2 Tax=Natrarchaeobius TaxID=2501796 RepID=A0A3N6MR64_NATCH|nr:hypothetical protein EA472_16135 [Natrarchaeobius chitinivorans]
MLPTPNTDPQTHTAVGRLASVVGTSVVSPVRASAFWTTILLPIVALALLVTGIASVSLPTIAGFLAAYGACAIAGHNHTPH